MEARPDERLAQSRGREARHVRIDDVPDRILSEEILRRGDFDVERGVAVGQRSAHDSEHADWILQMLEDMAGDDERDGTEPAVRAEQLTDEPDPTVGTAVGLAVVARIEPDARAVRALAKLSKELTLSRPELRDVSADEIVPLDQLIDELVGIAVELRREVQRVLVFGVVCQYPGIEARIPDQPAATAEGQGDVGARCSDRLRRCRQQHVRVCRHTEERRERGPCRTCASASSYGAITSSDRRSPVLPWTKSRSDVPLQAVSTFGALRPASRSARFTVRKSMLYRAWPVVLGTVECMWAAEKITIPPG